MDISVILVINDKKHEFLFIFSHQDIPQFMLSFQQIINTLFVSTFAVVHTVDQCKVGASIDDSV